VKVSDEVLVKKSKEGDYSSFEELVKRYEQKIYNLAYRIMGNRADARDILQETFLQTFRKLSGFKGKSLFSTWIYRIAVNLCLMRKRRDKIMKTVSLDTPVVTRKEDELKREFPEDWSKSPAATLENKELRETLNRAVNLLPEDYKAVFLLRDMNNLSNEEAAKVLKISVPAVKSRLHRARMFLRDEISKYFHEQGYKA
jgi:RNA polymerase sigma-70 factor (ECF subfamily)